MSTAGSVWRAQHANSVNYNYIARHQAISVRVSDVRDFIVDRAHWSYLIWFTEKKRECLDFFHVFNPLTAGAEYIRVFIFYHLLNMLKIKCDINQQYLKTVDLHIVKSE